MPRRLRCRTLAACRTPTASIISTSSSTSSTRRPRSMALCRCSGGTRPSAPRVSSGSTPPRLGSTLTTRPRAAASRAGSRRRASLTFSFSLGPPWATRLRSTRRSPGRRSSRRSLPLVSTSAAGTTARRTMLLACTPALTRTTSPSTCSGSTSSTRMASGTLRGTTSTSPTPRRCLPSSTPAGASL
eukprot:Amastigsp_a678267_45.p3 type:complete len:186 gc:universal Amastigsp_a678267_45:812-1369(+)